MKKKLFDGLGKIKNRIGNVASAAGNLIVDDPNWNKNLNQIISILSVATPAEAKLPEKFSSLNTFYSTVTITSNPILLIAVVSFHHKKGSIVEFTYPEKDLLLSNEETKSYLSSLSSASPQENLDNILYQLSYLCLPDGTHATGEDSQFFLIQNFNDILYGISCYKQVRVTQEMKDDDIENTRQCVQKSMCIVSKLPLFGQMGSKLSATMSAYFNQPSLKDKTIISELYSNYHPNVFKNIKVNEIYTSFSLKPLFSFCKGKIFTLMKYIMMEKKILVFSHISHNVCSFIFSLLSLFPGNSFFNCNFGEDVKNYNKCYGSYGLPLKFINKNSKFYSLMSLYDVEKIEKAKSFIIGSTNQLLLTFKNLVYDVVVNIDENTITFGGNNQPHGAISKLTKREKSIIKTIEDLLKGENCSYIKVDQTSKEANSSEPSSAIFDSKEDQIRNMLKQYILSFLSDIAYVQKISCDPLIQREEKLSIVKKALVPEYNTEFLAQWMETTNFHFWLYQHDKSLFKRSRLVPTPQETTIYYENGDCYIGEVFNGERNGTGNLTSKDGKSVYDGGWVNNKKNGEGQYFISGLKYNGQFKDDLFNGNGTLMTKEGEIYEGDFQNGYLEGMGHYTNTDGEVYVGNFVKGKFEGQGQYTDKNRGVYYGMFSDGKKNGEGLYIESSGERIQGIYEDGKLKAKTN